MKPSILLAKKEVRSFFDSLVAYVLLSIFLGICGFFTWLYWNGNLFAFGQASLITFFNFSAYLSLLLFIPAITMRSFAEEKKSGTIEILLTQPISDRQVVLGKFLACLALITVGLALTFPYVLTVAWLGNLDGGAVLCGYLALFLMSAAYIAIGIGCSSTTDNQIVAFLFTFLACLCFHFIFGLMGSGMKGIPGALFDYLGTQSHYESMIRGVIDLRDVVYFLSITAMGLFLAELSLARRNENA